MIIIACVRGIFLCMTNTWCLYNTTKITIIFICMKIFQQFCDVLVPYYSIYIFNFKYHTSKITLYDILFQELHVGQYFLSVQINVTTQIKFPCKLSYLQKFPIMNKQGRSMHKHKIPLQNPLSLRVSYYNIKKR
jgi:hypothetical protein